MNFTMSSIYSLIIIAASTSSAMGQVDSNSSELMGGIKKSQVKVDKLRKEKAAAKLRNKSRKTVRPNQCYQSERCFDIIKQSGKKITVKCKDGSSSAGTEKYVYICKNGRWDTGGFTNCMGSGFSLKYAGNVVCGRY